MFRKFVRAVMTVGVVGLVSLLAAQSPLEKGLELRYEGEAKVQTGGGVVSAKVYVNDLVTEIGEKQAATVASLRVFQPQIEGRALPPEAALRFLTITGVGEEEVVPIEQLFSESPPGGFIGQFVTLLPAYFLPVAQLKEGSSWTSKERIFLRADLLGEIRYQVTGREKVGDSECWVLTRILLKPVILQPEQGAQVNKVADKLWVDAKLGLVRQIQRETELQIQKGRILTAMLNLTLKDTKKLESTEFNQRLKELEAIRAIHKKVGVTVMMRPTKEKLDEAEKALNEFVQQFKDSLYTAHAQMWQRIVQGIRQRLEQEEQRSELMGKEAPDFELTSLDGKKVRLSSYRGKVVVLNFFAHWCGPCNTEAPHLEKEFWKVYKDKGVVVIGIAVWAQGDPFQLAKEFVEKHKLTYIVLVDESEDGKVAQIYGVKGVPTNVVIGKDGKIHYLQAGFDPKGLKGAIEEALK